MLNFKYNKTGIRRVLSYISTAKNCWGGGTRGVLFWKILRGGSKKIPNLFHPFFGFVYKCNNSLVSVSISTGSTSVPLLQPDSCTGWTYFSKNLTSIIDNWNQGQEFQVCLFDILNQYFYYLHS